MKFLDRFNLALFSVIILALSVIICLYCFGWLSVDFVKYGADCLIQNNVANKVALGVSIFLIILSMKSIFFNSFAKEEMESKEGILLENDNGKLLVSRDTIESLANTVVKTFDSVETTTTRVEVDEESHVKIFITLFVHPDAVIKEISNRIQTNIKETIKNSLDLEVTEVNIRVKNISVIIVGIVALLALILNLHKLLIWILIIVAGIVIGNYVQHNKEIVKEKLKSYIDKL